MLRVCSRLGLARLRLLSEVHLVAERLGRVRIAQQERASLLKVVGSYFEGDQGVVLGLAHVEEHVQDFGVSFELFDVCRTVLHPEWAQRSRGLGPGRWYSLSS